MDTLHISDCWDAGSDDPYCVFARDHFNYAVAENGMKWRYSEPEYDELATYATDNMIDWLTLNNMGFRYFYIMIRNNKKSNYYFIFNVIFVEVIASSGQ